LVAGRRWFGLDACVASLSAWQIEIAVKPAEDAEMARASGKLAEYDTATTLISVTGKVKNGDVMNVGSCHLRDYEPLECANTTQSASTLI
jgi:hypothetical protein